MKYFTAQESKEGGQAELKSHYKGYVGRNLQRMFAAKLVKRAADELMTAPVDQLKILDYGAASGAFFRQLDELGFKNFYGLDIDDYIDEENRALIKEIKTADCSTEKFPWPDQSFDIITAWCFLPHLENPHHCVRETLRLLKPGGLFILSIPHLLSRASLDYFMKNQDFARYHPAKNHISVFTPGVFKLTVQKYFETVRMEYLIDERSFVGLKGAVRKWLLKLSEYLPVCHRYLEKIWGYNQIWVLKKP